MIKENVSLKAYNTFGIEANAKLFVEVFSLEELIKILEDKSLSNEKLLILGGGSNVLFLSDFDGLVIKNSLKGKEISEETESHVIVKAGAGEVWHEFVLFCIENGFNGLENLSLIPGTVGAAPMQNIGAYGVEVKDYFFALEALNLDTLIVEHFDNEQCQFGYRESFFKHAGKGKYVILNVSFKLLKSPNINISYGAIQQTLDEMDIKNPDIKDVSNAVISIRQSKLPDPKVIGNAGSFFKNPEIPTEKYQKLKIEFPEIPGYKIDETTTKVPAGWLIEQAGWKGKKVGNVGVNAKQALVLVNFGGGTGSEIAVLAKEIQASVFEKYGIHIYAEVNFV